MRNTARRTVAALMPRVVEERRRILAMAASVERLNSDLGFARTELAQTRELLAATTVALTTERDDRLDVLRRLVSKVEHYQPLYGITGIVDHPARESRERARMIATALAPLRGQRVLDIGSSLGYMSFALADQGAHVVGWEYNPANAEVARQVGAINGLAVTFLVKELSVESARTIEPDSVDAALILAVLHHVIHYQGLETAQQIVRDLLDRIPVLVLELAVKGEDPELFWDATQPEDPLEVLALVKDDVEITMLGEVGTHLSNRRRPVMRVARRKTIGVGGRTYLYDRVTYEAYTGSPVADAPSRRRYFHAPEHIIKEYTFSTDASENWAQIIGELYVYSTLSFNSPIHHMANLEASELNHEHARLVLQRIPGTLLSDLGRPEPAVLTTVVRDVLRTLADLRQRGLHHNDVRSWNVMVNDEGGWLIDYGLASHEAIEDDVVALAWLAASVARGVREPSGTSKRDLPDLSVLRGTPLEAWVQAVQAGERDPETLLTSLA